MDLTSNRLVWRRQWSDGCMSGSVTTAGGLVFTGRNDGRLLALDVRDGKTLWQFRTDAGLNAPVTVFEHRGTQYIAAFSAGSLYARGATKGDSVWLFSLNGQMEEVLEPAPAFSGPPRPPRSKQEAVETAPRPAAAAEPVAPRPSAPADAAAAKDTAVATTTRPAVAEADIAHGEEIYYQVCQPCHGDDGQGGPGGGAPLTDILTVDSVMSVVSAGRNAMPEFGSVYTEQDLRDIATFVVKKLLGL
jgi:mono/diheme cytochrome c family protein